MTKKWPIPDTNRKRHKKVDFYRPLIGPIEVFKERAAQSWFESFTPGQRAELLVLVHEQYQEQQQRILDNGLGE